MNKIKNCLKIIDVCCWKCKEPMKTAIVFYDGSPIGPEDFDDNQIKIAKENGVILKEHFSKTSNETYLASTCEKCENFRGKFFLHEIFYDDGLTIDLD